MAFDACSSGPGCCSSGAAGRRLHWMRCPAASCGDACLLPVLPPPLVGAGGAGCDC